MFNFIKKNLTKLRHTSKFQKTREMPTPPTRDINRPATDIAPALGLQRLVPRPQNDNLKTTKKSAEADFGRLTGSPVHESDKLKISIPQNYNLSSPGGRGDRGNRTPQAWFIRLARQTCYPHVQIKYITTPC